MDLSEVVELNVGGAHYTTLLSTLCKVRGSLLQRMFSPDDQHQPEDGQQRVEDGQQGVEDGQEGVEDGQQAGNEPRSDRAEIVRDSDGRYFIDRDGVLFRFVLDFLRSGRVVLPYKFSEKSRLVQEAEYYGLTELRESLLPAACRLAAKSSPSSLNNTSPLPPIKQNHTSGVPQPSGGVGPSSVQFQDELVEQLDPAYISVGYRGTFSFGRSGQTDIKFRKLAKIYVCGRIDVCRQVFQDTLNESRDPDRGSTLRYSSRFYLKHSALELAFDMLHDAGFHMVGSCGTGTNSSGGDMKPGADVEERRWNHYNEFIFCR